MPAIMMPFGSEYRIVCTACSKCSRMGPWVTALSPFLTTWFACSVHSNVIWLVVGKLSAFYCKSHIGTVAFEDLLIELLQTFVNTRGTSTFQIEAGVGQSSVMDIPFGLMAIWSRAMTHTTMLISEPSKLHFSAVQKRLRSYCSFSSFGICNFCPPHRFRRSVDYHSCTDRRCHCRTICSSPYRVGKLLVSFSTWAPYLCT